jgi:RNA polymerase sigma factor (sigma-70 family)
VPATGPGSLASFQTFWEDHYEYFFKSLRYIDATKEDAEDTIGDVIADMMAKKTWDTLTDPKAWTRTAVLHTYYDRRRRERMRPEREIEGFHGTPDSHIDHDLNIWEDCEWVTQMLDTLPPAQREVFEYVLFEFKPNEIAEMLGKNPDAIRQNLAHARKRLRANLAKDARTDPVSRPAPTPRKEEDTP